MVLPRLYRIRYTRLQRTPHHQVLTLAVFDVPHLQGNSSGSCYVFDADTGARVTAVSAIKVSAPVRSCALSEDCRHLVAAVGKGFVFRFEYLGTANALNEEDGGSEGSEGVENRDVNAPPAATGGGEAAGAAPAAGMDLDSVPAGP